MNDAEPTLETLRTLPDASKEAIRVEVAKAFPNEACGFLATNGEKQAVFASRNDSLDPTRRFRTNAEDWQAVEDAGWTIVAIYHSHVNEPPTPSPADKTHSEKHGLPFIIVGWPQDAWDFYAPTGWRAELLGRPFVYGILVCYTLIRDYYQTKLELELPDFERAEEWWLNGANLYEEHYEEAGFAPVDDLREHDILLIQMPRSPVVNHSAIYLGDGMIMHHLSDRISNIEPYIIGSGYARQVRRIVRHKSRL